MPASARNEDEGLADLRAAIVAAGRRLAARGLIAATEGNLSIRLPGDRLLITPAGFRKDELGPADLVIVPLEAAPPSTAREVARGIAPSSDVAIHRAVLRARPDAGAVAHAHLPASMALTLAGIAPDPAALPETALLLPRLPFVPYGEPGSRELAERIAVAVSDGAEPLPGAALLERHGAVALGGGLGEHALRQAVDRLELVEVLCRTWRDAAILETALAAAGGNAGGLSFRGRPGAPDGRETPDAGRER